jgi:hypothetical protein
MHRSGVAKRGALACALCAQRAPARKSCVRSVARKQRSAGGARAVRQRSAGAHCACAMCAPRRATGWKASKFKVRGGAYRGHGHRRAPYAHRLTPEVALHKWCACASLARRALH